LIDAYLQQHPYGEEATTFHAYGREEERAAIDWILVSNHFQVLETGIDRTRKGSLFPSDHYPITAVLDWKS
jgi:endonuclease/exonuclease/phosphatase family metal-dependent hydrolase